MANAYEDMYLRSLEDPEGFWAEAAEAIHWDRRWERVLDESRKPFYRWFTGGMLNTCYNALDRHVENGRADQLAREDADFLVRLFGHGGVALGALGGLQDQRFGFLLGLLEALDVAVELAHVLAHEGVAFALLRVC